MKRVRDNLRLTGVLALLRPPVRHGCRSGGQKDTGVFPDAFWEHCTINYAFLFLTCFPHALSYPSTCQVGNAGSETVLVREVAGTNDQRTEK
jgi:hypothetical protein